MKQYPESQLAAASEILEMLSVPFPHTLQEKIRTIEASKTALAFKLKDNVESYYTAMRKVANEIKIDRLRQQYNSLKNHLPEICLID
jgi:hypothetical protein